MSVERDMWIVTSMSILSFLGCIFIIIMYYYFTNLQNFGFRLIKDFTIFNLINAAMGFLPINIEVTCEIQGIGLMLSSLQIVLWSMVISLSLYLKIVRRVELNDISYRNASLIIVNILSAIGTFLPFCLDKFSEDPYGRAGPRCLLKEGKHQNLFLELAIFYVPCFCAILFNLVIILSVIRALEIECWMTDRFMKIRLWLYPMTLLISYLPCGLIRLLQYTAEDRVHEAEIVCSFTAPMTGLLNALIYGFTLSVRRVLYEALCLKRRSVEVEIDQSSDFVDQQSREKLYT